MLETTKGFKAIKLQLLDPNMSKYIVCINIIFNVELFYANYEPFRPSRFIIL